MFQNFINSTDPQNGGPRITALRKQMRKAGLDWYLVPHGDEHQNEYLPACAERLFWLTGFSGSAGFAIIGLKRAFILVDGRYTVQVRGQVDTNTFEIKDLIAEPPLKTMSTLARANQAIGYDPMVITLAQADSWHKQAKDKGFSLKPLANLIDKIWQDRPAPPTGKATIHPVKFAGKKAEDKIRQLQAEMKRQGSDLTVLTDPASIAWLLNIRGRDVVHNPIVLAFASIGKSGKPRLYVDRQKFSPADQKKLGSLVFFKPYGQFLADLGKGIKGKTISLDPHLTTSAIGEKIKKSGGKLLRQRDPVALPRAIKNETELEGSRAAHLRDGVAMARFLCWLDSQAHRTIDEIGAATQLEKFRTDTAKKMGSKLLEISFDTISGAGANGAIVHYRVTHQSNARLKPNSLYLTDSGAQYIDGTTDITRTIAIGKPPLQAVTDFTLVLKGHIALAMARFPKGTRGVDLDILARKALWRHGKDYAHGTGHGVGSYLNVHEGPQSISRRSTEPLQPGMVLSNEPGYYREGKYGIRIENLVAVTPAETIKGGDQPMLGFETLTLCPIDLRLIDKALLTGEEINWLNAYHARVQKALSPHLNRTEKKWLKSATAKL